MSIFLTDEDRKNIGRFNQDRVLSNLHWALMGRISALTEAPGPTGRGTTTDYWHHVAEYVGDAAGVGAIKWDPAIKTWVRDVVLSLVRLPPAAWVGPAFRTPREPYVGCLETTHLTIATALALDVIPEAFQPFEIEELRTALRERSIVFCRRYLAERDTFNNWRAILTAGLAVAGAVLGDETAQDEAAAEFELCNQMIQDDGSYGESLQYSNYCYYGLMMTFEALTRANPEKYRARLEAAARYPRAVQWFVTSLLYRKPLSGWGEYPRPRSVNFNDSAAIFGADPDLLMHIAMQFKTKYPEEAGLARWLFDYLYRENPSQGPFDRTTFGFVNRYGFISYMYHTRSAEPIPPDRLPLTAGFDNGNCIARSSWDNDATVLALNGSAPAMNCAGHLHRDLNSIILAHRRERMLADPGHCCYRNLIHKLDADTDCHNTCTFLLPGGAMSANLSVPDTIRQQDTPQRRLRDGVPLPAEPRPGRRLIVARLDDVSCLGNDAAAAYGAPLERFARFTFLCGENVVFVLDRIRSAQPVGTIWNWLLNNRDNELEYKTAGSDRMVVRRGNCGMKIFHLRENDPLYGPHYGYMHDAYHVLPHRQGEGFSGSGLLFRWQSEPATELDALHAIVVDEYGYSSGYHLRRESDLCCSLEEFEVRSNWRIAVTGEEVTIGETVSGREYRLELRDGKYCFSRK